MNYHLRMHMMVMTETTSCIQGIADCLFKEEDGWVLLDYKTDRYKDDLSGGEMEQEMQNRYGIQLRFI